MRAIQTNISLARQGGVPLCISTLRLPHDQAVRKSGMRIAVRPARVEDFDFCSDLYFSEMGRTIRELNLDVGKQAANLRQRWALQQVRIITLAGDDIGWVQSMIEGDALFLGQLFVAPAHQGRGIGTTIVRRLIEEAACERRAVTLGVVKTSPALRLYRRLGFRTTHEDDRKFYMRRDPDPPTEN
jgi:ribosomal protein S18 acetylase RimI-like enzyme